MTLDEAKAELALLRRIYPKTEVTSANGQRVKYADVGERIKELEREIAVASGRPTKARFVYRGAQ